MRALDLYGKIAHLAREHQVIRDLPIQSTGIAEAAIKNRAGTGS
jgi:hypothetical protein